MPINKLQNSFIFSTNNSNSHLTNPTLKNQTSHSSSILSRKMGIKTFVQEIKIKISASRFFKAMVVESKDIVPKFTPSIKNIEIIHGESFTPGCVVQTHFADGAHFKYMKVRVDDIDREKHTIKYTLFEGDMLGDKLEKISYELKVEDTEDGCVVKVTSEYHTKGDYEIPDEVLKGAKEQASGSYKACEEYLIANPNVCA